MHLDQIQSPEDIKNLSYEELTSLAHEIRESLILHQSLRKLGICRKDALDLLDERITVFRTMDILT